jgi:hypothetical protein
LRHQRLGAAHEFLRVDFLVGDVAPDAHQLLLPLQQAQADLLLRVFDVALHRLLLALDSCSRRYMNEPSRWPRRKSSTAISGASMA